jgi:hypothetical protein
MQNHSFQKNGFEFSIVFAVNFRFQMLILWLKINILEFFGGLISTEVSFPFKCLIQKIFKNFIYKFIKNETELVVPPIFSTTQQLFPDIRQKLMLSGL